MLSRDRPLGVGTALVERGLGQLSRLVRVPSPLPSLALGGAAGRAPLNAA